MIRLENSMRKKIVLLPLVVSTVGTAIWFFMVSLGYAIEIFREHWVYLLAGLPVISLLHAYVDHFKRMHRLGDTESIQEEVRNPSRHVHWLLAPWIFLMTAIFHLFGASVGRESTAVQMGGSLAETLGRLLRIPVIDRPILIRMGLSAGFGAAFGVPWAGTVFGLESPLLARRRDWLHLPFYIFCSWGADRWAHLLGLRHLLWKNLDVSFWEMGSSPYLLLTVFLVVLALGYEVLFRWTSRTLKKQAWWMRAGLGGLLILLLTLWVGEPVFNNLGTHLIMASFEQAATFYQAAFKLLFTVISILAGMKGGEVTPLMAAGALFGSWFGGQLKMATFQLGAAIGLVTLFTSRLRIPFTGIFMLWEIFDWKIALLGAPTLLLVEYGHRKLVSKLF